MATDNLQCVFVFLLFQMVLIYHWISSWLSVCFMYEGYSGSKQRQYGSKSLIFGKYQNITTLQHFALKKNIPHINAANGVQKIQQTFLGGKQTSISTANSYVILCRNCQGKKFFKIQSRNFCDKTFCDMGDDTDYISLNLPPNLKLWRLVFFYLAGILILQNIKCYQQ